MFDRTKIKQGYLKDREHRITIEDLREIWFPKKKPKYENSDLDILVRRIIQARDSHRPVILVMGAHVIRRGGSRFITDLMRSGAITHVACNGACAVHEFELALIGATCEDVERYIKDGQFGYWEDTGFRINSVINKGFREGWGYGESIAYLLSEEIKTETGYKPYSIFAIAHKKGIPITVHKGIGYDIVDQHPLADGMAIGATSYKDFLIFADSISKLENGVFLNMGTQVMGPEIYLKALSMARNVAKQEGREIRHFTTAVFDIREDPDHFFRPKKTILERTIKDGGESFYIQGDFADTIPNLHKKIFKRA